MKISADENESRRNSPLGENEKQNLVTECSSLNARRSERYRCDVGFFEPFKVCVSRKSRRSTTDRRDWRETARNVVHWCRQANYNSVLLCNTQRDHHRFHQYRAREVFLFEKKNKHLFSWWENAINRLALMNIQKEIQINRKITINIMFVPRKRFARNLRLK